MNGITLIGMPGSGKSTVGKILAEKLSYQFIDLDKLILEKEGKSHDRILAEKGEQALKKTEERLTLELNIAKTIFAPGGSIVYSYPAMEKLAKESQIFYLYLPLEEIKKRLGGKI